MRLRNMEAGQPDEKFVSEFLEPHVNQMNEETGQWLKDNGYAPILPVDIQKWLLQQEEKNQQDELRSKER